MLSFGAGAGGRLGHGDELDRGVPAVVAGLRGVGVPPATLVAAGAVHSTVQLGGPAGELFTFGGGSFGQLGVADATGRTGSLSNQLRPARVDMSHEYH